MTTKRTTINIVCDAEIKTWLKSLADAAKTTESEYVRQLIVSKWRETQEVKR